MQENQARRCAANGREGGIPYHSATGSPYIQPLLNEFDTALLGSASNFALQSAAFEDGNVVRVGGSQVFIARAEPYNDH